MYKNGIVSSVLTCKLVFMHTWQRVLWGLESPGHLPSVTSSTSRCTLNASTSSITSHFQTYICPCLGYQSPPKCCSALFPALLPSSTFLSYQPEESLLYLKFFNDLPFTSDKSLKSLREPYLGLPLPTQQLHRTASHFALPPWWAPFGIQDCLSSPTSGPPSQGVLLQRPLCSQSVILLRLIHPASSNVRCTFSEKTCLPLCLSF